MTSSNRALYISSIADFIQRDASTILGYLVNAYHGSIQTTQSEAWKTEIELLQIDTKQVLNGQFHVSEEFLPMCEKLCYSAPWFGTPCKRRLSRISF